MRIGERLRYGLPDAFPSSVAIADGMTNWWYASASDRAGSPRVKLDAGINSPAELTGENARVPFIAIRSSPHKAGTETTPWEDLQRPDDGYARYYGDNKAGSSSTAHETRGNRRLIGAWRLHSDGDRSVRLGAPPILLFQGFTHEGRPKGQLVFNGIGVIDRSELIVQVDPKSRTTFANYRYDLTILDLAQNDDVVDWRWLNDRRDPQLSNSEALKFAPAAWKAWVEHGTPALDRLRRNALRSRIVSDEVQQPATGSAEAEILASIYSHYSGRNHRFESFADFVTHRVLASQGVHYTPGWITAGSGDGGLDFVGRIDLDPTGGFVSSRQVVLGQAKCESPTRPTNGVHLARLVARLRRGWFGVYVTTSYFSRSVQREVLQDRYPLLLIHGARVASIVREHLLSTRGSLTELIEAIDASYEDRIRAADPEHVLLD